MAAGTRATANKAPRTIAQAQAAAKEEHEQWKNEFAARALRRAKDNGYCDEVESFLEEEGFDIWQ